MDKHDIIINILSIITLIILIIFLIYPIWGTIIILKITQISTIPPIIWWMIHTLTTILWVGTIIILIKELGELVRAIDSMDRLKYY